MRDNSPGVIVWVMLAFLVSAAGLLSLFVWLFW
jgi:hypothetical protein